MESPYYLKINGIQSPQDFVREWYLLFKSENEDSYIHNIYNGLLNKHSFSELLNWKMGHHQSTRVNKNFKEHWISQMETLQSLQVESNLELCEKLIQPEKNSTIYKIFLLHLINPDVFPILDQHVYRFFMFSKYGVIKEIPHTCKKKYQFYKEEYQPWFNKIKNDYNLNQREMDRSFLTFGIFLKSIIPIPKIIVNETISKV